MTFGEIPSSPNRLDTSLSTLDHIPDAAFVDDAWFPRHAFGPTDRARAGHVWRAFQETAVRASTHAGYSPERYREEGIAFVVRTMSVLHHEPIRYGPVHTVATWVRRMRRRMLCTRELRMFQDGKLAVSATQEWVHVSESGGVIKPMRGSDELCSSFEAIDEGVSVELTTNNTTPALRTLEPMPVVPWHSWMDPLGHVNHPTYLDFIDEALFREAKTAGRPPHTLLPLCEKLTYFSGLSAGDKALVTTEVLAGNFAIDASELNTRHEITRGDERCVTAHVTRCIKS